MALTTVATANVVKQWDSQNYREFVRKSRFFRYTGPDANNIIHVKQDLSKKAGDQITISLVAALTGAGQTGNGLLEGNEEALANYGWPIMVETRRHAVAVTDWDMQKTEIDLRNEAKYQLTTWGMQKLRTDILNAMGAIYDGSTYANYASASEANKDTWLANNSDRVLFGALKSNNSSNDHSASLANLNTTTDVLNYQMVSLMKRMAKMASPIVPPVRVKEDEEWYVCFVPTLPFRDLKASLASINQNAEVRGKENPLFTDGDLQWDGVVIREIPEIASIGNVGASSAPVYPTYFCGAQAIGHAIAQRWETRTDVRDYQFVNGVAVHDVTGTKKTFFNNKQHGMLTGYVAAAADA